MSRDLDTKLQLWHERKLEIIVLNEHSVDAFMSAILELYVHKTINYVWSLEQMNSPHAIGKRYVCNRKPLVGHVFWALLVFKHNTPFEVSAGWYERITFYYFVDMLWIKIWAIKNTQANVF